MTRLLLSASILTRFVRTLYLFGCAFMAALALFAALNPAKYVVLNTGLTIEDRGYNGDYGTPLWGDYAIVKVKPGADVPEMLPLRRTLAVGEITGPNAKTSYAA